MKCFSNNMTSRWNGPYSIFLSGSVGEIDRWWGRAFIIQKTNTVKELLFYQISIPFDTSHKQYLCDLLFSRNLQRTHTDHCTLSGKKRLANLQTQQPQQNLFSSAYVIYITCFGECFSFYVITGKRYFL